MPNAAFFECRTCDGRLLGNGSKASPFQIHRRASLSLLVCDGCAGTRAILREGESIPVSVGRWPNLPPGIDVPAEAVVLDGPPSLRLRHRRDRAHR